MKNWFPDGATMNCYYYKQVLETLCKRIEKKTCHSCRKLVLFFIRTLHWQTLCSRWSSTWPPSLFIWSGTIQHFFFFFLISLISKFAFKGTSCESVLEVNGKIELLRQHTEKDLLYCFDHSKIKIQWYVVTDGNYIEGKVIEMKVFFKLN